MFSNIWVEAIRATNRPLSKPKMSRSPTSSAVSTRARLAKNFLLRTSELSDRVISRVSFSPIDRHD